jgi:hypothetical protein
MGYTETKLIGWDLQGGGLGLFEDLLFSLTD